MSFPPPPILAALAALKASPKDCGAGAVAVCGVTAWVACGVTAWVACGAGAAACFPILIFWFDIPPAGFVSCDTF